MCKPHGENISDCSKKMDIHRHPSISMATLEYIRLDTQDFVLIVLMEIEGYARTVKLSLMASNGNHIYLNGNH